MLKVFIILITLFQGALTGNAVIFQTPDVLTISYIKKNPNFYDYCDQQLEDVVGIDEYHSFEACKGLSYSANNDPPTNFSNMNGIGGDFDKWARSKEYRGYIHIPSFNVKCDAKGYLVSANPRDPDYRNQENPTKNPEKVADVERNPYGFTKIPIPLKFSITYKYKPADIYAEDPTFIGFQSKPKTFNNNDTCLNILDFRTSRLSHDERYIQQEMTKTDAPFIFTYVNMKVCCNRQVSVTVSRSIFPQTRLYIDGKMFSEQEQTDLGRFILSGGRQPDSSKLSKDGHGKTAPSGKQLTWNKKV